MKVKLKAGSHERIMNKSIDSWWESRICWLELNTLDLAASMVLMRLAFCALSWPKVQTSAGTLAWTSKPVSILNALLMRWGNYNGSEIWNGIYSWHNIGLKYIYATNEFMLKCWKTSWTLDWCWRFGVANIWAQAGSTDFKLFPVMWVGSVADHYDIWWIRYAGLCLHYCPNIKWLERFSLDRSVEQDIKICIAIIQTIHGRWS